MPQGDWYYCLDHHTVEPYEGCRSATRLGPYPSAAAAADAIGNAAQRNEAWANDPRFNDEDEEEEVEQEREEGWGPFRH